MKMAARASYKAVPSMLMVAPTGSTKRVTRLSTLLFSSKHLKVMGSVAELWHNYSKSSKKHVLKQQPLQHRPTTERVTSKMPSFTWTTCQGL